MAANSALRVTELDFDTIKTNLKAFLSSQSEFKDYDFEGSSMSVLLDLLAYNTHYNAFYLNMVSNEMFLDTALLRNNVVARAKAIGYVPRSMTGSTAVLDLQIFPVGDLPNAITIDKNTPFTSTVNNTTFIFNTESSTTISPNSNNQYFANGVTLRQGVNVTHTYTANTLNEDQKFILPNANTDTSTLTVKLKLSSSESDTHLYTRATDVLTINSTSNVYFLNESTDGKFEVTFGDDVLGRKIQTGNIVILESLICEGNTTNGAATFRLANTIGGYSNVSITTNTAAFGGTDRESISSIKQNAPKQYETQNRAVTVNDYRRILTSEYNDADSIAAWGGDENDPPVYGKVYIAVKPKSGLTLTTAAIDYIKELLSNRKIITVTPEIVSPDYIYLILNCNVKYDSRVSQNSAAVIAENVKSTIVDFGQSNLTNFDLRFRYSKLTSAIDAVDPSILNNLLNIQLEKKVSVTTGVATNYTVKFSNEIYHPNDTYIGSITSTNFSYNDSLGANTTDCKIDDNNGVLRVVKTIAGVRTEISNNIGTVDYTAGTLSLVNFNPNSITGNTVDITVTPASSDVTPIREQILLIDTNDVTVTATTDQIEATGIVVSDSSTTVAAGGSAGSGGSGGY